MKRIGIIAALPGELKPLVKPWKPIQTAEKIFHWEMEVENARWVAVCAGIGKSAATRSFAEAEKDGPLTAVLSIGWAGGLSSGCAPGQIFRMTHVTDTQTGEQFRLAASREKLGLLTTARVADHAEKHRLAQAYPGAMLVDMEAATVARLAAIREIPCYCFKAVSDGYEDRLPDLNRFIDANGQFRTASFVLNAAWKPACWSALVRFGDNSRQAAENLATTIRSFLADEGYTQVE